MQTGKLTGNSEREALASFLNLLADTSDSDFSIESIWEEIGRFYQADRSYIFELDEANNCWNNTFEWCDEGINPEIDNLQGIPYDFTLNWLEKFRTQGTFLLINDAEYAATDPLVAEILELQGIDCLLSAPLTLEGKIKGFIGVDNPKAHKDYLLLLALMSSSLYKEIINLRQNEHLNEISKLNARLEKARRALLRTVEEQHKSLNIVGSLSHSYESIYYIDLATEEFQEISSSVFSEVTDTIGKTGNAREKFIEMSKHLVRSDFVEDILEFTDLTTLPDRLKDTNRISFQFYGIEGMGWCVGEFIPADRDQDGRCIHVLWAIRNVNDQKLMDEAREEELRKVLEVNKEHYSVLKSMSEIFYSMHLIDLTTDTVRVFSAQNEVAEIVNKETGATDMMRRIMSAVVTKPHLEAALEFTDLTTLRERMQGEKALAGEFIGSNIGWFLATFITIEADDEDKPVKVIYTTRTIDLAKRREEILLQQSRTDELTGLLNRRAYEDDILEMDNNPRIDSFVFVSFDVNGLKTVNDTLGHAAGDELLTGASECMKKCFGEAGNLYRMGGDEFVALIFADQDKLDAMINDFNQTVGAWSGQLVKSLAVAVGTVSKTEFPASSVNEIAIIADKRMYKAKSDFYRDHGIDRRAR